MLLTVEEGIRAEICNAIHRYAKANNKYMKDRDKNKESSYLKYALVIAQFREQYGQYFTSLSYFADLFNEPLGE